MASALNLKDTKTTTIAAGRLVLEAEAGALVEVAAGLGDDFAAAVDLIDAIEGRVVVTGMGKSGHVARKIAATLASTGTPALFVHPAEASHGDLGMITTADLVLALSNSGETAELRDLVFYAKRYGIPLVAVTARRDSTLGRAADDALVLPPLKEACPMGLTPTSSTTAMLALGDALAVALLRRRGFSAHDFSVFHPGGKLGSRLMRVEALMHRGDDLPLATEATPLQEAIVEMTGKRLGCVGVVGADGRLVGILTDGDLRRHLGEGLLHRAVGEVMTEAPRTIEAKALVAEALAQMNRYAITVLFVVEDGRPVGALHLHDCLRAGVA